MNIAFFPETAPVVPALRIPQHSLRSIANSVCAKHKVRLSELTSHCREWRLIIPRWEFYWRARNELAHNSYSRIGKFCGNRDHSTILHGVRKFQALLDAGKVTV